MVKSMGTADHYTIRDFDAAFKYIDYNVDLPLTPQLLQLSQFLEGLAKDFGVSVA